MLAILFASLASLVLLVQRGAEEAWDAGTHPFLHDVAIYGPWILAVVTVLLLLRAFARAPRYRAVSVLGAGAQSAVTGAIRDAESRTVGEIVPVVLERSDDHAAARWRSALLGLLVGSVLLERFLPWSVPHELLACQLGLAAAGFLLARFLPDLERLFVSEASASAAAAEQALQEFQRQGLRETAGRTGILIFVSLFERRVVVLGDEGIHQKTGDDAWKRTRDAILDGVSAGRLAEGLVEGVAACGAVLAAHYPSKDGGVNEIADRLVVRNR